METNIILPKDGYYWVGVLTTTGLQAVKVTDELRCACGGSRGSACAHVESVKAYLRLEGRDVEAPAPAGLPEQCPICGSRVMAQANHWRCAASAGHYWQWRGEQSGVKAFLTQPHPAKQGPFYEQTVEEREAFLESISFHNRGFSPYG